ncbi:Uncharacterized protein FKW44_000915 [Caligus rogercresseyi]|uniref:Uncharacterized protein n=1 Tax=Caligus rogercresseyi TaxID=217165 RepID=A0A7T8QV99_CALRO|nr:Uncharacterized protein FKW44_000915 [Caligus rogercresseyi]
MSQVTTEATSQCASEEIVGAKINSESKDSQGGGASNSGGTRRKLRRRKSERWRRGRRNPAPFNISNDEMLFLKKNTRYDEEEIKDWYRGFRNDCPDGTLTKKR